MDETSMIFHDLEKTWILFKKRQDAQLTPEIFHFKNQEEMLKIGNSSAKLSENYEKLHWNSKVFCLKFFSKKPMLWQQYFWERLP